MHTGVPPVVTNSTGLTRQVTHGTPTSNSQQELKHYDHERRLMDQCEWQGQQQGEFAFLPPVEPVWQPARADPHTARSHGPQDSNELFAPGGRTLSGMVTPVHGSRRDSDVPTPLGAARPTQLARPPRPQWRPDARSGPRYDGHVPRTQQYRPPAEYPYGHPHAGYEFHTHRQAEEYHAQRMAEDQYHVPPHSDGFHDGELWGDNERLTRANDLLARELAELKAAQAELKAAHARTLERAELDRQGEPTPRQNVVVANGPTTYRRPDNLILAPTAALQHERARATTDVAAFTALATQVAEIAALIRGKDSVAALAGPPRQGAVIGPDGSGPSYAQVASEDGALEAAIAASLLPAYSGQQPGGLGPAEPTIAEQLIAEMAVKAAAIKAQKAQKATKAAEAKAAKKLEMEAKAAAAAELAERIRAEEAEDAKVAAALQVQMDELAARSAKRKAAASGEGALATAASRKKAAQETAVLDQIIATNVEQEAAAAARSRKGFGSNGTFRPGKCPVAPYAPHEVYLETKEVLAEIEAKTGSSTGYQGTFKSFWQSYHKTHQTDWVRKCPKTLREARALMVIWDKTRQDLPEADMANEDEGSVDDMEISEATATPSPAEKPRPPRLVSRLRGGAGSSRQTEDEVRSVDRSMELEEAEAIVARARARAPEISYHRHDSRPINDLRKDLRGFLGDKRLKEYDTEQKFERWTRDVSRAIRAVRHELGTKIPLHWPPFGTRHGR